MTTRKPKHHENDQPDTAILPVGGPRRLPELEEKELREREERIAREQQEAATEQ